MVVSDNTEYFYRSLLERSSEIILLIDQKGTILFASPSINLKLGYSSAALIGKNLDTLIHPQDIAYLKTTLDTLAPDESPRSPLLCRFLHQDGSWYTFENFPQNLLQNPFVQGIALFLHDVTNRQRAEEAQQRSIIELARSNAFIAALSKVAERVTTTIHPSQVMETLGRELEGIGLTCAVLLREPDGSSATLEYLSIKPTLLDLLERQTGLALQGFRLPPEIYAFLKGHSQKAEYHADIIPFLVSFLHEIPKDLVVRAVRLTGVTPFTPLICLPMKVNERALGELAVWGSSLSEGDISALSVFANQVASAIDKAILLDAIQRRVQETETLREAASIVTSALDLEQVLDRILTQLARVIAYDSAVVFLLEDDQAIITACHGIEDPHGFIGQSFPSDILPFREIVQTRKPIILADIQADSQFLGLCNQKTTRTWMGIPLFVRGTLIGFLTLESRKAADYGKETENLAITFANQAAIAIENARLFKQVQHLAITDSLTGLYNRRHFFELAGREFERSLRYGHALSLMMWDIDHFKQVNDRFGHIVGDQALQAVTQRCRAQLREVDILGRYGGEEFVALLPETNLEPARQAAERLCQAIAKEPFLINDHSVSLSISLGVTEFDRDCANLDILVQRADEALYLAKQAGRNSVAVWRKQTQ